MRPVSYLKIAGKSIVILLAGVLLGVILLTLSFLLPANQKHLEEARALIDREAWYPMMPELSAGMYFETYAPGVLDNSSDSIMLYTAMDDSEGNPLVRAMDMYSDYAGQYSYYWHGYVTVLRPLSLLFDYGEIRVLNGMLQMLLVMIICHMLWKKKGFYYAALFFMAYCLLMPAALGVSLQYSWVFYISFLGTLLLIRGGEFWEEKYRYLYFFLIQGMLTSYFDLLTYPLFTWGFPLVMYILVSDRAKSVWKWLGQVVFTGIFWIVGYGGMWYFKWILGTWILKRDILQAAMDEIFLRVGVEDQAVWSSRWNAIAENWKHYEYVLYMLLILCWLLWLGYKSVRVGWKRNPKHYALALIALAPFVWYGVLTNHTTVHHLFTYRIFSISILAVLSGGVLGLSEGEGRTATGGRWYTPGIWGGILAGTCLLLLGSAQDKYVFNGECNGRNVLLPEGQTLVSEFQPLYSDITRMHFCILTESTSGAYRIELYQGEELIDSRDIRMDHVRENYYFSFDVDWHLDIAQEYELAITAMDGNADSYMIAANPGEELRPEYGDRFRIGEQMEEGQILVGVNYRYQKLPEGKALIYRGITGILACMLPALIAGDMACVIIDRKREKKNEMA